MPKTGAVDLSAPEELRKLYSDLVETSQDLIWQCDAEGRYVYLNHAWETTFGYRLDEMLGRKFSDFQSPEFAARDVREFSRLLGGGTVKGYETVHLAKSGREIHLVFNAKFIRGAGGEMLGTRGTAHDITQRKKIEDSVRASEKKFKNIIDSTPMGMHLYELAGDGRLIFAGANPAAAKILGLDHSGLFGKPILEAFPGLTGTDVPARYIEAALHGTPWRTEQIYYDAGVIKGAFEVVAFQTEPRRMVAMFVDITERKRTAEAVSSEREQLAVTLRSIGDGVITTDTNGVVVLMNQVAEELCGWTQERARGKPLFEVFNIVNEFTRQPCENPVDKVLKSGEVLELANHTLLISAAGVERVIADSGAPIKNSKSETVGVVLVFRDITEKKKIQNALQHATKLESLGLLAGGIAHDFNNLMGGIYGCVDLANEETKDESVSSYLAMALNTIDRARGLTTQLLTFAKGGAPIQRVTPLVPFIQENTQFALSGSSVSCNFKFAEGLWSCNIDKNQISQVIDNIVINAQQAMPDGGTIDVSASNVSIGENAHPVLKKGRYVRISIRDYGIGIPRKLLDRIFDPFFTTKSKGHGLGLATCYSIVKRHDGALDVESEPGRGSVFHIYLPASTEAGDEGRSDLVQHSGSGTILVMDDEQVMRDTIGDMLESAGYTVVLKSEGLEVLDYVWQETKAGRPIVALLLDLTVPGSMGGKAVAAEIRKINTTLPIFVASGYADDPVMRNPADYGFTASICKPFRKSELLELFNRHLPATQGPKGDA